MRKALSCFTVLIVFGFVLVTPLFAIDDTLLSEPLAHFRFEADAKNKGKGVAKFELKNTQFKDQALYLNGKYEWGAGSEANGYRAVCLTPTMNYETFTVVIKIKPEEFTRLKNNLITGGLSYRWFGLQTTEAGALTVTFNNQAFSEDIEKAVLEEGKWATVACGVNVPGRKVVVYFKGKRVAQINLPKDFELAVLKSKEKVRDKSWSFTNYSNGNVFHGLVKELLIYDRVLSPEEFEKVSLP
jgi:hypothetical protein